MSKVATSNWNRLRVFRDPDSEIFLDEVDSNNDYTNPLLDTISAGRSGDAQCLVIEASFLKMNLVISYLSYVIACASGERIYCGSALDLLGVDPALLREPDFLAI